MDGIILNNGNLQIDLSKITEFDIVYAETDGGRIVYTPFNYLQYSLLIGCVSYSFTSTGTGNGFGHSYAFICKPALNMRRNIAMVSAFTITLVFVESQITLQSNINTLAGNVNFICIPQ